MSWKFTIQLVRVTVLDGRRCRRVSMAGFGTMASSASDTCNACGLDDVWSTVGGGVFMLMQFSRKNHKHCAWRTTAGAAKPPSAAMGCANSPPPWVLLTQMVWECTAKRYYSTMDRRSCKGLSTDISEQSSKWKHHNRKITAGRVFEKQKGMQIWSV